MKPNEIVVELFDKDGTPLGVLEAIECKVYSYPNYPGIITRYRVRLLVDGEHYELWDER